MENYLALLLITILISITHIISLYKRYCMPMKNINEYFKRATNYGQKKQYEKAISIIDSLIAKDEIPKEELCNAHNTKAYYLYKQNLYYEAYLEFEETYRIIEKIEKRPQIDIIDEILDCYNKVGQEESVAKWKELC